MNEDKCPNCHDWIRDCICEEDDDLYVFFWEAVEEDDIL
jgi:hypothetical protein